MRPVATAREPKTRSATISLAGVLTLTEAGRPETSFWLTPVRSDWGRAYRLDKFRAEGGETYRVCLSPEDGRHSCTCPGHSYRGKCRHVSALLAIVAAGRMPDFAGKL